MWPSQKKILTTRNQDIKAQHTCNLTIPERTISNPKLFQPKQVGSSESRLKHLTVTFAPTGRCRADGQHALLRVLHVAEYYGQRAKVSGTLPVTEATMIALRAGSYPSIPGIWSEAQIAS